MDDDPYARTGGALGTKLNYGGRGSTNQQQESMWDNSTPSGPG